MSDEVLQAENERDIKLGRAIDCVRQLAFRHAVQWPGGLLAPGGSADMDTAFKLLGWQQRHPAPDWMLCDVPGCREFCNTVVGEGDRRRQLCSDHSSEWFRHGCKPNEQEADNTAAEDKPQIADSVKKEVLKINRECSRSTMELGLLIIALLVAASWSGLTPLPVENTWHAIAIGAFIGRWVTLVTFPKGGAK